VSNLEVRPGEVTCEGLGADGVESMVARDVPLGGPRAMSVRRTLPQRGRSMIGAWCFVDRDRSDPGAETGGMVVEPHPHTGLATVSWIFTGEIEHRDSAGHRAMVRPGDEGLVDGWFGTPIGDLRPPIPAPVTPQVRLRGRR